MDGRFEIRFVGSGGQGVILATKLIGHAAAIYEEDHHVVQSQAYSPEARGGKSKAEIILSKEPIDYPKVMAPRLQVILTQLAADEYARFTVHGGYIIYDDFFVTKVPKFSADISTYYIPIVRTAREKFGRDIVTNMIALGAAGRVFELEGIMTPDSLRKSIYDHFSKSKIADLNVRAFDEGYLVLKNSTRLLSTNNSNPSL